MFCITIEHKSSCDTKILLFAAWRRAKLWVHSLGLPKHTQNVRINLQEIFVFICSQKYTLFLQILQNIINFLFSVIWTCLAISINNDNANLKKLWCLSAYKKWTLSLTSFLRYCTLDTLSALRMLDYAHQ